MVRRSMISNIMAQKTYTKWYGTLIFFGTVQKRRGKATLFFLGIQLWVVLLLSYSIKFKGVHFENSHPLFLAKILVRYF